MSPISFAQTTQPGNSQLAAESDPIVSDFSSLRGQLFDILGDPKQLADPSKRQTLAPQAIPILKKMIADLRKLQDTDPKIKEMGVAPQVEYLGFLTALGDTDAATELRQHANSKDAAESIAGVTGQLNARWLLAGNSRDEQNKVVNDIESAAKAHPDSAPLTLFIASLSQDTESKAVATRLEKLATETMNNPAVDQAKGMIGDMKEQKAQMDQITADLKKLENKPLEIKGKTADGKDFTTNDWKGKVVVVDFWATWCGPCVAEMPGLKRIYEENHAKGLEVVGISNDRSIDALNKFTEKNNLPWPQLFDPNTAATGDWNPTSMSLGVKMLPTMFVIDKKGIVRSVEGRKNLNDLLPQLLTE